MKLKDYISKCVESVPNGCVMTMKIAIIEDSKKELVVDDCEDHDAVNTIEINLQVNHGTKPLIPAS